MEKQTRQEKAEEKMQLTMINTFDGKFSLFDLCERIGVRERVEYYNMIEKLGKAGTRPTRLPPPEKVVHTYGIILNDGFEVKRIEKSVYNLFKNKPLKEVRERK